MTIFFNFRGLPDLMLLSSFINCIDLFLFSRNWCDRLFKQQEKQLIHRLILFLVLLVRKKTIPYSSEKPRRALSELEVPICNIYCIIPKERTPPMPGCFNYLLWISNRMNRIDKHETINESIILRFLGALYRFVSRFGVWWYMVLLTKLGHWIKSVFHFHGKPLFSQYKTSDFVKP